MFTPLYKSNIDNFEVLLTFASDNKYDDLKYTIDTYGYKKYELNQVMDKNKNNMLHFAVLNNNPMMVDFLLEKGVESNQTNKFNVSPWKLAISLQYQNVIDKFVKYKCACGEKIRELNYNISMLESKLKNQQNLENTLTTLNRNNVQLSSENKYLQQRYDIANDENRTLRTENTNLKQTNKRLRDECDDLINKNKKLKTSVDTLIANNRK